MDIDILQVYCIAQSLQFDIKKLNTLQNFTAASSQND